MQENELRPRLRTHPATAPAPERGWVADQPQQVWLVCRVVPFTAFSGKSLLRLGFQAQSRSEGAAMPCDAVDF